MVVFFASEWTHAAPQSFRLNIFAPSNMPDMSLTFDTSHFVRSPSNDVAPRNIPLISFTCDTSHFEMSASKDLASENMRLMSVTRDTSHAPIGPCGPLKHSPLGESSRHATTALLSCDRDSGENATVGAGWAVSLSYSYRGRLKQNRLTLWGSMGMTFMLRRCNDVRTAARSWQKFNEDHAEQNPKTRRQTHLRGSWIALLCLCTHLRACY